MMTAIVPARSGSKRLPGKNMLAVNGKPLVFHTIDAVLGHPEISKVVYSTDSTSYARAASEMYSAKIQIEIRPDEFGGDSVKVYDEVLRLAKSGVIVTDWFMLCLPTAPLRNQHIVRSALDLWNNERSPIFSACAYDFPVQFAFELDELSDWSPVFPDSPMITGKTRSQDIQSLYRPNGAIYIGKTSELTSNGNFYTGAKVFVMSKEQSVDVDDRLDLILAESLLKGL